MVTIFLFVNSYYRNVGSEGKIAIIFLGTFALYFLVVVLIYQIIWGRKVRYAEVLPHINLGFSYLHEEIRSDHPDLEKIATTCERICTQLTHAFSIISGTPCSISIKVLSQKKDIGKDNTKIKVLTLARDQQSASFRGYPSHVDHWLDENTDFRILLEMISTPRGRYFFCNQLPFRKNYQNTSIAQYGGEPKAWNIPGWKHFVRHWRWPLPYKSTIVVPICPALSNKRVQKNLIGYLCVDSPKLGAFKKQYDVDLMEGVADGLYNLVSSYITQIEGGIHYAR